MQYILLRTITIYTHKNYLFRKDIFIFIEIDLLVFDMNFINLGCSCLFY